MECKCTMSQSVLGDGCEKCNPAYAVEMYKETIADLEGRVAELEAERAELVKDAERYRHIRGMFGFDSYGIFLPSGAPRDKSALASETDAAIDAAREGE